MYFFSKEWDQNTYATVTMKSVDAPSPDERESLNVIYDTAVGILCRATGVFQVPLGTPFIALVAVSFFFFR